MTDTKQKAKPPGKFKRQFIAPYSLESCKSMLENIHEPPVRRVWQGGTRIHVDTWRINDDTIGFRVYTAPKSKWEFRDWRMTRVYGRLARQPDGTASVEIRGRPTFLGTATIAIGYLLVFLCLIALTPHGSSWNSSEIALIVGILLVTTPLVYLTFKREYESVLVLVKVELS